MQRSPRCLTATTTALKLAGPTQFTRTLEGAACTPWSRHVLSQTRPHASGSKGFSPSESNEKEPTQGVVKKKAPPPHFNYVQLSKFRRRNEVSPLEPSSEAEVSRDSSGKPAELARSSAYGGATYSPASVHVTEPRPAHSPTSGASIIPSLPVPHSPQMFYDNILFASSSPPPPDVEELIGYHSTRPDFQSPKSYNTCIDFAINRKRFDVANQLFDAMTKAEISFNSVTCQLLVRLHARQFSEWTPDLSDRPILRKGSASVRKILSVIHNSDLATEPEDFLRYILDCLRPVFSGWEVHPLVVKAALYSITNRGMTLAASELASTYFSSLPAEIDEETKQHCLDMIHHLLGINTKGGLPDLYNNQKLLSTLFKAHRSLQPTPDTLFLLLSPLKRAKNSGTVAVAVMNSFRKWWGPGVVDERVKQRIMKLAQKEGRSDIVEQMMS